MHRKQLLTLIGVAASLSSAIFLGDSAYAAGEQPSISISIPAGTISSETLAPSTTSRDWKSFEVPVTINIDKSSSYMISVYNSCAYMTEDFLSANDPDGSKNLFSKCSAGNLVDIATGNTLASTSSTAVLTDMTNQWGYRWQMGNKYNIAGSSNIQQKSFTNIPTSLDAGTLTELGENGWIDLSTENYKTKDGGETLTLEFGASVNGSLPSGTYQGAVAITVTAKPEVVASFGSLHYMQDMNANECNKINPGTEGYMRDKRDNKLYKVAKLKDGNCWMIQNLALAGGSVISSADSDIPTGTIKAGDSNVGIADTYKLPDSSSTGFTGTDTGFVYNGSYKANTYNTEGFVASATDPSVGTDKNEGACNENSTGGCKGKNSGTYYSWGVATVNSSNSATANNNAPASICPKGWKLPTSGSRSETQFPTLYSEYDSHNAFATVWHGGTAGYLNGGSLRYSGTMSYWWSRTAAPDSTSYRIDYASSSIHNAVNAARAYGASVRCVVDMTKPTMQNFTASDCSNLVGETELVDSRDNKVYKVAKLADGNCWMTQNLALDSGTTEATRRTITPADSDVTANYTLPVSSTTGFNSDTSQFMYNGTHKGLAFGDVVYEDAKNDTNSDGDNTGAYYSWLTATAGSGAGLTTANTNASSSICPKGWKLPTGGADALSADTPKIQNGQFQRLYSEYGNFADFQVVWKSEFPGRYDNSGLTYPGIGSDWWTSTVLSDAVAYYLTMVSSDGSVYPQGSYYRKVGSLVRCVKTPTQS